MSFAYSRTGISTLRMKAAAYARLKAREVPDSEIPELALATSVCTLDKCKDRVIHALRLMIESQQEVTLTTPDQRSIIRTTLTALEERESDVWLRIGGSSRLVRHDNTPREAILTGHLLNRPLVVALEVIDDLGTSDTFYRLSDPGWMLLADQRATHRVRPTGYSIRDAFGWSATLNDLSEDGLSLTSSARIPHLTTIGDQWSGVWLSDDKGASIPVTVTVTHILPVWNGETRIGARLRLADDRFQQDLQRMIAANVRIFSHIDGTA